MLVDRKPDFSDIVVSQYVRHCRVRFITRTIRSCSWINSCHHMLESELLGLSLPRSRPDHYCFQNKPFHQLLVASAVIPKGSAGDGLSAISTAGTVEVVVTVCMLVARSEDTVAGKGMAAEALAASFLPNCPESGTEFVWGQNLQVARAVAVAMEAKIQIPATRMSFLSLRLSSYQANRSRVIIASRFASFLLARINDR